MSPAWSLAASETLGPAAYMVVEAGFDQSEVEAACRAKLASFKAPRKFMVVETLPRTALGKIQKHLLPKAPE